ncbi:3-phosphoshikimate 1-carboxyvinyltransferase [Deltaproteobacteria bacterium]|nr:3-phosphoshikimate 1-carboxyvinyltransferase [Deltaproteobacteria bacterium]
MTKTMRSDDAVAVTAPASKSASHRYLIGAALAHGVSCVRNALESQDLERTRNILCAAGAGMRALPEKTGWEVRGMAAGPRGNSADGTPLACDVHESGTTCRLLTAVLASGQGFFRIHGAQRMHERPIAELAGALTRLGARIRFEQTPGCPPLLLEAQGLDPARCNGLVTIGMDISSQYFSGLLLAAPLARTQLTLEPGGHKAVSWPYVGLTLQCLEDFNIRFSVQTRPHAEAQWQDTDDAKRRAIQAVQPGCLRVTVKPGVYKAGSYTVEGDWSNASYLLAAGALGHVPVRVEGLRTDSLQGDRAFLDILKNMGARLAVEGHSVTVYPSTLHGMDADMSSCPDLAPTVAALAAFAQGTTRISNVAHLRFKESDRITAPATELRKAGVRVEEAPDGLLVHGLHPTRPRLVDGLTLVTHNDHRIAMSLALLGCGASDTNMATRIDDPAVVRKSFPDFWKLWSRIA